MNVTNVANEFVGNSSFETCYIQLHPRNNFNTFGYIVSLDIFITLIYIALLLQMAKLYENSH